MAISQIKHRNENRTSTVIIECLALNTKLTPNSLVVHRKWGRRVYQTDVDHHRSFAPSRVSAPCAFAVVNIKISSPAVRSIGFGGWGSTDNISSTRTGSVCHAAPRYAVRNLLLLLLLLLLLYCTYEVSLSRFFLIFYRYGQVGSVLYEHIYGDGSTLRSRLPEGDSDTR